MVSADPAPAQEKKADNFQIVIEKMQADKKLLTAQALALTESEARAFWPVYASYQPILKNLFDRLIKVIQAYADNYGAMSDEDARGLLDEC